MTMTETEYQQRTEKRIDSLLEVIDELRQGISRKDAFIEMMSPHMAPFEAKFDEKNSTLAESMCELVRAYRRAKA